MDKKDNFSVLKNLSLLSQFGLSLVIPILLLIFGTQFLRERYGFGSWITLLAIVLGLLSCIPTVINFAGYMLREAKKSEDDRRI